MIAPERAVYCTSNCATVAEVESMTDFERAFGREDGLPGRYLVDVWRPVVRRSDLDEVRDVEVLAVDADRLQ